MPKRGKQSKRSTPVGGRSAERGAAPPPEGLWAGLPCLPVVAAGGSAEQALLLRLVCKAWRDGLSTEQATARVLKLVPSQPDANASAWARAEGAGGLEVQLHHTYEPPASEAQLELLFSNLEAHAGQVSSLAVRDYNSSGRLDEAEKSPSGELWAAPVVGPHLAPPYISFHRRLFAFLPQLPRLRSLHLHSMALSYTALRAGEADGGDPGRSSSSSSSSDGSAAAVRVSLLQRSCDALTTLTTLEELHVSNSLFGGYLLGAAAQLTRLTSLRFDNTKLVYKPSFAAELLDELLQEELDSLQPFEGDGYVAAAQRLRDMHAVKKVDIVGVDDALARLGRLARLRELQLDGLWDEFEHDNDGGDDEDGEDDFDEYIEEYFGRMEQVVLGVSAAVRAMPALRQLRVPLACRNCNLEDYIPDDLVWEVEKKQLESVELELPWRATVSDDVHFTRVSRVARKQLPRLRELRLRNITAAMLYRMPHLPRLQLLAGRLGDDYNVGLFGSGMGRESGRYFRDVHDASSTLAKCLKPLSLQLTQLRALDLDLFYRSEDLYAGTGSASAAATSVTAAAVAAEEEAHSQNPLLALSSLQSLQYLRLAAAPPEEVKEDLSTTDRLKQQRDSCKAALQKLSELLAALPRLEALDLQPFRPADLHGWPLSMLPPSLTALTAPMRIDAEEISQQQLHKALREDTRMLGLLQPGAAISGGGLTDDGRDHGGSGGGGGSTSSAAAAAARSRSSGCGKEATHRQSQIGGNSTREAGSKDSAAAATEVQGITFASVSEAAAAAPSLQGDALRLPQLKRLVIVNCTSRTERFLSYMRPCIVGCLEELVHQRLCWNSQPTVQALQQLHTLRSLHMGSRAETPLQLDDAVQLQHFAAACAGMPRLRSLGLRVQVPPADSGLLAAAGAVADKAADSSTYVSDRLSALRSLGELRTLAVWTDFFRPPDDEAQMYESVRRQLASLLLQRQPPQQQELSPQRSAPSSSSAAAAVSGPAVIAAPVGGGAARIYLNVRHEPELFNRPVVLRGAAAGAAGGGSTATAEEPPLLVPARRPSPWMMTNEAELDAYCAGHMEVDPGQTATDDG